MTPDPLHARLPASRRAVRGLTRCAIGLGLVASIAAVAPAPLLAHVGDDTPAQAAPTPADAVTLLHEGKATPDQLESLEAVLKAAGKSDPASAEWKLGLALIDRARGKRVEARDALEPLAESDENDARVQLWYGLLCFETVQQAGTLEQATLARAGRDACERAIELDPSLVAARVALVQFYVQAPALFGGSYRKARTHAQGLIDRPEPRTQITGHLQMAFIEGHREDWEAMEAQYALATQLAESRPETERADSLRPVLRARAGALLNQKKDAKAALAVLDQLRPIARADDASVWFLTGEARRTLADRAGAIEAYERALAINPDATNSRWNLAQLLEAQRAFADAATHFDEFAKRFPNDERAGAARDSARRLRESATKNP